MLFIDLVGFTPYSERADPEQVRSLQTGFFATARRIIRQHGGVVEKYIGDAVMALFGAPVATETDPLRCVRAGLELQRALARQTSNGELRFRVGIATGEALVDVAAARDGGQAIVAGDVVPTASRLQSSAPVGGVLVCGTTYAATKGAIRYAARPPVTLRGRSTPTEVWLAEAVVSRRPAEERDGTPLIDREHELGLLVNALHRAAHDRVPQLVTVFGRAGIGKTRLVRELYSHAERLLDAPLTWRTGYCPPFGEDVTYAALGDIVKAHAGILDTDSADQAKRRLIDALADVGAEQQSRLTDALAPLVGLPGPRLTAEDAEALWRRFLLTLAERRPTVLLFEDVHLADPAMRLFIERLAAAASDIPLLVLCTARPELLDRQPAWAGAVAGSLTISLPPLRDDDIAAMYAQMFGQAAFPVEMLAPLVEFADGNPLYAHEYARMLIERGSVRRGERSWSLRPDEDVPMPDNVQAVIANRIDLLDSTDRAILQAAAVVGAQFWPGAVAAAVGRPVDAVERALRRLEQRDLVREQAESSMAGQPEYRFRHVLVREVCYKRLPRTERVARHDRTAGWLADVSASRADDMAEVIARHRVAAYDTAAALGMDLGRYLPTTRDALHAAARRAYRLHRLDRAAAHAGRALGLYADDEADGSADRLRLELLATELSFLRDTDGFLAAGGPDQLAALADRLLAAGDVACAARAATLRGTALWVAADRDGALRWLNRAVELFGDLPDSDEKATAYAELARLHMLNYEHEEAAAAAAEALAEADRLGLVEVSANAMITLRTAEFLAGSPTARQGLEETLAYCREHDLPSEKRAALNLAWAMQEDGEMASARQLIERYAQTDAGSGHALVTRFAEEAMFRYFAGDWPRMLAAADAFLDSPSGEWDLQNRVMRAWVRVLRGEAAGGRPENDEVDRARAAADRTGFHRMRWSTLGHGALCRALQGRCAEARAMLADLCEDWRAVRAIAGHEWVAAAGHAAVLCGPETAALMYTALGDAPRRTAWTDAALAVVDAAVTAAAGDSDGAARRYLDAAEAYAVIGDETDRALATAYAAQLAGNRRGAALLADVRTFAARNEAPRLLSMLTTADSPGLSAAPGA